MKTLILNGSPKGNSEKSISYFFAKCFADGLTGEYEIHSIQKEKRQGMLVRIKEFDSIIVITPNYIHAIPGDTLDFLYAMPVAAQGQSIGFIIQCGFTEGSENELMSRFFETFAARFNYRYLGTVMKGECGGYFLFPDSYKKLGGKITQLSASYEQTGRFDEEYCKQLARPYSLSKFMAWMLNTTAFIGDNLGWNKMLKDNNAFDRRKDMPYLEEKC